MEYIENLDLEDKPIIPEGADVKWRFFHRLGKRPDNTEYGSLNLSAVQPENFENWTVVMDKWGNLMLNCATVISEMVAVGLGLEKDTFTKMMEYGSHLLAPTATNLV